MSNLRHLSVTQLETIVKDNKDQIGRLKGRINGMQTRLQWAEFYINHKAPGRIESMHHMPESLSVLSYSEVDNLILELISSIALYNPDAEELKKYRGYLKAKESHDLMSHEVNLETIKGPEGSHTPI